MTDPYTGPLCNASRHDGADPRCSCSAEASVVDQAREMAARGLRLLPLRGKVPIRKGWRETAAAEVTPELATHLEAGGNYGCNPPEGTFGVDVDTEHGGLERWAKLLDVHGPIQTLVVETGSGGLHVYLLGSAKQTQAQGDGIDVRTSAGQLVGPGSVHPETGRRYRIIDDSPIAVAPVWLVDWLAARHVRPASAGDAPRSVVGDLFEDAPRRGDRAARYEGAVAQACDEIAGLGDGRRDALLRHGRALGGRLYLYSEWGDRAQLEARLVDAGVRSGTENDVPKAVRDGVQWGIDHPLDDWPDRPLPGRTVDADSDGPPHDQEDDPGWVLEPQPEDEPQPDIARLAGLLYTDLGNALRMGLRHGRNLRWCEEQAIWYAWTGTHWARDQHRTAHRLAHHTVERLWDEIEYWNARLAAATTETERGRIEDRIKAAQVHALKSQGTTRIAACYGELRARPGQTVALGDLDRNTWHLPTLSGTLDLQTGELAPHRREDLHTGCIPVVYNPAATCLRWERFVAEILPDEAIRAHLQRAIGYSLTGDVSEQLWWLFRGEGSNGKSVFIEVIRALLGPYAMSVPRTVLEHQPADRHPTEIMDFAGRRFAAGVEPRRGGRWDAERIKALTGGDEVKARHMHKDFVHFRPTAKLFVACNDVPRTEDDSHGWWRRIIVIPFVVQFRRPDEPEDDRPLADPGLTRALLAELPGILMWALRGLEDWRRGGMRVPDACRVAVQQYRAEQDPVSAFVAEECDVTDGFSTSAAELYAAYRRWHEATGRPGRPLSSVAFGRRLGRCLARESSHTKRGAIWTGIRLQPGEDPPGSSGDGW